MIEKIKAWLGDVRAGAQASTTLLPQVQRDLADLKAAISALNLPNETVPRAATATPKGKMPAQSAGPVVLKVEKKDWSDVAQTGELSFHRTSTFRSDHAKFTAGNASFFKGVGFKSDQFIGKTIVDLGAGSKLRALYFTGAHIIAIEPLAEKFIGEIEWCDLNQAAEVYSAPAEQLIDGLTERVDFLFSINVLDHCYDFVDCVENIFAYLRPGGTAFLAFDCHQKTDDLHPIIINEKVASGIFFDVGFRIDKMDRMPSFHRGIAQYAVGFYLTRP